MLRVVLNQISCFRQTFQKKDHWLVSNISCKSIKFDVHSINSDKATFFQVCIRKKAISFI